MCYVNKCEIEGETLLGWTAWNLFDLVTNRQNLLHVWVHVNTCAQRIMCTWFSSWENCKLSLIWSPSLFILIWMKNNLWGQIMTFIRQNFENSLLVCYQTNHEVWCGAGLVNEPKSSLGYDTGPSCSLGKMRPLFSSNVLSMWFSSKSLSRASALCFIFCMILFFLQTGRWKVGQVV